MQHSNYILALSWGLKHLVDPLILGLSRKLLNQGVDEDSLETPPIFFEITQGAGFGRLDPRKPCKHLLQHRMAHLLKKDVFCSPTEEHRCGGNDLRKHLDST
eukprot:m.223852 g.223852  ORF g.223852 m.223852 type:complete len:102 (+) comp15142_c0_seq2:1586-1891(+)